MKYNNADFPKNYATGDAARILLNRAINQQGLVHVPILFYRYVVLDVMSDPQFLGSVGDEDAKKRFEYWRSIGVSNMNYANILPRNAIIGQRINDANSSQNELPIFLFPFFPSHLSFPCKPGEHVWVMFESGNSNNIGYWFCKVTEVNYVDDVNHTHPPRSYESSFFPGSVDIANEKNDPEYKFRPGRGIKVGDDSYTSSESSIIDTDDESFYEKLLTDSDASQVMVYESVPRFRKRPGDIALEGSNNTLIVMGTDRTGPYADVSQTPAPKKGKIPVKTKNDMDTAAGSIDIVAGRGQTEATSGKEVTSKKLDNSEFNKEIGKAESELVPLEGDPDWKNDRSRVLITQRTKVDTNLGLSEFNKNEFPDASGTPKSGLVDEPTGSGAIVIKSDKVRIIARMDVEILVSGFETDKNGNARSLNDPSKYAAIVIRSNGDIIFRPSASGVIKLGGDDANLAVLCNQALPGEPGTIQSTPIIDTMGGSQGQGGAAGQFAKKVLLK